MLKKIIINRNLLLVASVVLGIGLPSFAEYLKPYAFWILAFVMMISLTSISNKVLLSYKKLLRPMLVGILLNHVVFGFFIIIAAYIFSFDINLFYGFIIIAAAPPGVAIIPFTAKLGGDIEYSIIATFGAFLASIFLSPFLIKYFSGVSTVSSLQIFKTMIMLIFIPFVLSRFLLINKIYNTVVKVRGKTVDIGFSLIIYTSVGLNSHIFYEDFLLLFELIITFLIIMFLGGWLISLINKSKVTTEKIVSNKLIFAIKSSGFAVVTAIEIFGDKAAVPSTVMSVMVLLYLFFQLFVKYRKGKAIVKKTKATE